MEGCTATGVLRNLVASSVLAACQGWAQRAARSATWAADAQAEGGASCLLDACQGWRLGVARTATQAGRGQAEAADSCRCCAACCWGCCVASSSCDRHSPTSSWACSIVAVCSRCCADACACALGSPIRAGARASGSGSGDWNSGSSSRVVATVAAVACASASSSRACASGSASSAATLCGSSCVCDDLRAGQESVISAPSLMTELQSNHRLAWQQHQSAASASRMHVDVEQLGHSSLAAHQQQAPVATLPSGIRCCLR